MSEQIIDEMKGQKLFFRVEMVCPQGYKITPEDIKRILDSEMEQVITSVKTMTMEEAAVILTKKDEVKKCECGGILRVVSPMSALYQVVCLDCGKTAPMGYTPNGAIEQWNKQEGSNG